MEGAKALTISCGKKIVSLRDMRHIFTFKWRNGKADMKMLQNEMKALHFSRKKKKR